jgi:flagellar motility protein MotE (MotC chaperone)
MKKLLLILAFTLALNFLGAVGGVAYLFQSGKLDKAKLAQVKALVFSPPPPVAATQPSAPTSSAPGPRLNLADLLANHAGLSAIQQVDFVRRTFDAQMMQLDQRQRELLDLKKQIDLANAKLAADRTALEKREKDLADREQEAQKLQDDQGFQTSLSLYSAMPSRQVKNIFMTLNETTVQQYLQAMDTRTAGKIIKEFKTSDETAFIQRVLERIRLAQVSATDGKSP